MLLYLAAAGLTPAVPTHSAPVISAGGAAGRAYPGEDAAYRLELVNHTDQIVYDGLLTITLPLSLTYVPGSTIAMGEGWPLENREPLINGQTLTWGPYHLPAAGNKAHNPYGIHTLMYDCVTLPLHLEAAKMLVGNGGYITQLFYGIDATTTGPADCVVKFVTEAYARNIIPIIRLEGHFVDGMWQAPNPGLKGDYAEVAQGFANYVAGLPRRDTNPLYIQVWNEPDLWIEWSNRPNATEYARFFVAVSNAIRRLGDARIRILSGALTPGNPSFIDQMHRVPGFKDAYDAWNSHCYPYNHPASYNRHQGTAKYPTYAIDCYLEELAVVNRYRANVKVVISEGGYELGNNTFGFEGFPSINETNRAAYIGSAFKDYWRNWPEVIASTPFQLADTAGLWWKFDWISPAPPYPPHAQFNTVAAQIKPNGDLEPYGFQIMFKARVDPLLPPGHYPAQLAGSERDGSVITVTNAVTLTVQPPGPRYTYFFPIIYGPARRDGPWYLETVQAASPGTIVPTALLNPAPVTAAAPLTEAAPMTLTGQPLALALAQPVGLAAVLLADGRLDIVDLPGRRVAHTLTLGQNPHTLVADPLTPGRVYVGLENMLVYVDLPAGQVIARRAEPGRWRGLAVDPAARRLYAADAHTERLVVFSADLTQIISRTPLERQPDRVLFDPAHSQLYLTHPATSEVTTYNLDNNLATRSKITGGPILAAAIAPNSSRLVVLNALAPAYRGLTTLQTPWLQPIALAAGAEPYAFKQAQTLAATSGGLLLPESSGLWQVNPDNFAVTNLTPGLNLSAAVAVAAANDGSIYVADAAAHALRIFQ